MTEVAPEFPTFHKPNLAARKTVFIRATQNIDVLANRRFVDPNALTYLHVLHVLLAYLYHFLSEASRSLMKLSWLPIPKYLTYVPCFTNSEALVAHSSFAIPKRPLPEDYPMRGLVYDGEFPLND